MHPDHVVALPVRPVHTQPPHRNHVELFLHHSLAHCGHTFCQGCLTNWFNTTRRQRNETGARGMPAYSCPSCRHPVRSHPVQNFSLKRLAAESRGESTAQRPPPVQPPLRKRGGGGPFNVFFGLAPP
jgi:hypothetical protein